MPPILCCAGRRSLIVLYCFGFWIDVVVLHCAILLGGVIWIRSCCDEVTRGCRLNGSVSVAANYYIGPVLRLSLTGLKNLAALLFGPKYRAGFAAYSYLAGYRDTHDNTTVAVGREREYPQRTAINGKRLTNSHCGESQYSRRPPISRLASHSGLLRTLQLLTLRNCYYGHAGRRMNLTWVLKGVVMSGSALRPCTRFHSSSVPLLFA
jgi:hypothetical protein